MKLWDDSRRIVYDQSLLCDYIFEVKSEDECEKAEQIVSRFKIDKYHLKPIYTGNNIHFFENNVYLTKKDVLETSLFVKGIFLHQVVSIFDFLKINIMPNGDVYSNLNAPIIGNIFADSITEIVYNEINRGVSWFRVHNQYPCNDCVLQWLCSSPSDYEIAIGRPNLCHVN